MYTIKRLKGKKELHAALSTVADMDKLGVKLDVIMHEGFDDRGELIIHENVTKTDIIFLIGQIFQTNQNLFDITKYRENYGLEK